MTLDSTGTEYKPASGFILNTVEGLFLYTCWHVVTGYDFHDPKVRTPPIPKSLDAYAIDVQAGSKPGVMQIVGGGEVTSICGQRKISVDLYDQNEKPLWQQSRRNHRVNKDLNELGIFVPQYLDVVRLPIELPPELEALWAIDWSRHVDERNSHNPELFTKVTISGFPFGYSPTDSYPTPIYLSRAVACEQNNSLKGILLDGGGAAGMSGGPIWTANNQLLGMYTGIMFPDYSENEGRRDQNDRYSALGLCLSVTNLMNSQLPGFEPTFT